MLVEFFLSAKIKACGSKTYGNDSILVNPKYPQGYSGGSRCTYQIHQESYDNICQLRIDFLSFSLAQPNGDGMCNTDYFTVEGGTYVPKICGQNMGQHIYVEVTKRLPVTVIVATTESVYSRRWQLQVTQIGCKAHQRGSSS